MIILQQGATRWWMALFGMLVQLSIGSVYAYSMWVAPLHNLLGWEAGQVKNAFSLAIVFLGLTAAFAGHWVGRVGPKRALLTAAICYGSGLACAALAIQLKSIGLFYLGYGVISGFGLGLGYIAPVSVVISWFPDRPGLASGLIIMSFALGSMIAAKLIPLLVAPLGLAQTFYLLAVIYFVAILFSSLCLKTTTATSSNSHATAPIPMSSFLTKREFWGLWSIQFLNTCAGISLISVAASMGSNIGLSDKQVVGFVMLIGFFNGFGRLAWSALSDKLGRWNTFICFFLLELIAFFTLATFSVGQELFIALTCLIISCYGGCFACMPAFVRDVFGAEAMGQVLGCVLTAWSAAGIVGPWIIGAVPQYATVFYIFCGFMLLAGTVAVVLRKPLTENAVAGSVVH